VNVPETFPFSLSGTVGTVRGRRSETRIPFRATVRPPVSSNDHYEGSTRQRPVTNYILLAQSRPARTYTMRVLPRGVAAHRRAHTNVAGRGVRWRKSKSLGRLKASLRRSSWLEFLPRFPWKASTERIGGGACRLSSVAPSPSSFRTAGRPAKSSAREGLRDLSGIHLRATRNAENAERRRTARPKCYRDVNDGSMKRKFLSGCTRRRILLDSVATVEDGDEAGRKP